MSMFFDEALFQRHSVRTFDRRPVAPALLWHIMNAGRMAPSAKNSQPWRFIVLSDDERKGISLAMCNSDEGMRDQGSVKASAKILERAPAAIAVTAPRFSETKESMYLSMGACLENMCLKATDLGLGSLIICDIQCAESEIADLLKTSRKVVAILAVGYEEGLPTYPNKFPLTDLVEGLQGEGGNDIEDDLPEAFIGDEPFIFISYSHRDSAQVVADLVQLKHCGVRLWYDRSILNGEAWDEKALCILDKPNCVGVFVYISRNSANSANVCIELEHARKKFGKSANIVGIHIGDKVFSSYLGGNRECDAILQKIFSDKSKYIPRSETAGETDHILEMVSQALGWGAVADSGIYDNFRYTLYNNEIFITKYQGTSQTVVVPSVIIGRVVTTIGPNAFRDNGDVRKIVLPQSIKRVEEGAFFGMTSLEWIFLPDSIEYLGVAAFRKCRELKNITLPKHLKKLEEALFRECTALTECIVPNGVEEMGEAVFNGCSHLERAILPDSLKRMTEGGFFGCGNLRELVIPRDIQGLEKQSFETCPFVNVDAGGFRFRNGKAISLL